MNISGENFILPAGTFARLGLEQGIKIACMCWCTADHKVTPILFKYIGEDNLVYTVRNVRVKRFVAKPDGFQYNEYICEAPIGGFMREFRLWHIPRDNEWLLIL